MKKIVSILFLLLAQGCGRVSSNETNFAVKTPEIIAPEIQPTGKHLNFDGIQKIFKHLDQDVSNLEEANTYAQKNLLRSGERWDAQLATPLQIKMEASQEILLDDLRSIGMTDAVYPSKNEYDYALFMGALKATVSLRLEFLKELIKSGCHFNKIVLLGGERPLQSTEKEGLPQEVNTEAEMMSYLFKPEFAEKDIILINSPMIKKADGTFRRPNTDDTLYDFIALVPQGGSCLVISNNPFIERQTKVARRILPESSFSVEGTGSATRSSTHITMLMDEFARLVYEEYKATKNN